MGLGEGDFCLQTRCSESNAPSGLVHVGSCAGPRGREGSQHPQLILGVREAETHGKGRSYPPPANVPALNPLHLHLSVCGVLCLLVHGDLEEQELLD